MLLQMPPPLTEDVLLERALAMQAIHVMEGSHAELLRCGRHPSSQAEISSSDPSKQPKEPHVPFPDPTFSWTGLSWPHQLHSQARCDLVQRVCVCVVWVGGGGGGGGGLLCALQLLLPQQERASS